MGKRQPEKCAAGGPGESRKDRQKNIKKKASPGLERKKIKDREKTALQ